MNSLSPWTDDRIEQLRAMTTAGLPTSEIAARLGNGISRNAVIGKAGRLGLVRDDAESIWADARVAELKRLFFANLTFSDIAARLGNGITKNAAQGKCLRLGLRRATRRVAPPKPAAQPRPRKPTSRYATRWGAYSAETKLGELPPTPVADLVPLNIAFADIGAFQCRWIVEDQPALFCGHPALTGSWCPTHRAIVYTPRTVARRALEAA